MSWKRRSPAANRRRRHRREREQREGWTRGTPAEFVRALKARLLPRISFVARIRF